MDGSIAGVRLRLRRVDGHPAEEDGVFLRRRIWVRGKIVEGGNEGIVVAGRGSGFVGCGFAEG